MLTVGAQFQVPNFTKKGCLPRQISSSCTTGVTEAMYLNYRLLWVGLCLWLAINADGRFESRGGHLFDECW